MTESEDEYFEFGEDVAPDDLQEPISLPVSYAAFHEQFFSPFAEILIRSVNLPFQTRYETYKWVGAPHWPVKVPTFLTEGPKNLPWELELLYKEDWGRYGIYIRTDTAFPFYIYYRLQRDYLVILNFLKGIKCRLILTAMVWGLAHVPEGVEPSRHHLGKKPPY